MKERPILFSGEMVRAVLSGRKTQTRRPVKPQPYLGNPTPSCRERWHWEGKKRVTVAFDTEEDMKEIMIEKCPFGQPGDRLWTRETWAHERQFDHLPPNKIPSSAHDITRLKYESFINGWDKVRPSIYMPRWASRITLEVVSVRVERVQEISTEDVIDEGFKQEFIENAYMSLGDERDRMQNLYMKLWNSIYGNTFPWESNPWCWCISFRRLPCQKIG